jgi:hypothetical protein
VSGVVASRVTQVDPSYEGDISLRGARMSEQHQLLVM